MESLSSFIKGSNTFAGFTFNGYYDMPSSLFLFLFDYYNKTGENLLDAYSHLKYISWSKEDDESFMDDDKFNIHVEYIKKCYAINIINENEAINYWNIIKKYNKNWHDFNNTERIRQNADSYISQPEIKDQIFKKYGKICLCCGSEKNIALDHVKPVSKGGENTVENLQPLCRVCNSKKGTKTIDYRK